MEQTDQQQEAVQRVVGKLELSERALVNQLRRRWDHFYALWRSYHDFKGDMAGRTDRRDRDQGLKAAQREWGATLFIPYVYASIETVLPRLLSNRPRMLVLPRNRVSEANVDNVKFMIDAQQKRTGYERKLQSTVKSGLIFGLGVQKTVWLKKMGERRVLEPASGLNPQVQGLQEKWITDVLVDDPDAQNVSIYDFFWQPTATDMETCRWVVHRIWMDRAAVMERIRAGRWMPLEEDDLRGSGSGERYQSSMAQRQKADGVRSQSPGDDVHEVLEFHDRERVLTVLDRKWLVADGMNPMPYQELPFQVYRPTEVPEQMAGIGEAEAIEDLQIEMNTLRTQRRDNATLKLMQTYAYADGAIDPDDIKVGPGSLIPVMGEPRDLLQPLMVGDIPNSGYAEEDRLRGDIERTSGISDIVQGGSGTGGAAETATGAQLVLAGANARIQLKTRRAEIEIIEPQTRHFVLLSQQRITENRDVRVPHVPKPGEADRRWAWVQLGPTEIAGEFDFECEGGSTAPENVPQQRQDAMALINLLAPRPELDGRAVLLEAMRLMGLRNPEQYMAPEQSVPPQTMDVLMGLLVEEKGMNPEDARTLLQIALDQGRQMQEAADQQGPIQAPPPDETAEGKGPVQGPSGGDGSIRR